MLSSSAAATWRWTVFAPRAGWEPNRCISSIGGTEEDMPADHEEIIAAQREGIIFHYLTTPTGLIVEDNTVKALEMVKMQTGGAQRKRALEYRGGSGLDVHDVLRSGCRRYRPAGRTQRG